MREKGKLISWNDEKGFGFVAAIGGNEKVFIHIRAFRNRNRRPVLNDVVTYDVTKDDKGRTRAMNATLAADKLIRKQGRSRVGATPAILESTLFLAAVGMSVLTGNIPPVILAAYIAVSIVTFITYAIDKSAAQSGRWRTSESALHFLALTGGWPGAWIAQQTLRHKSKKVEFRSAFWVTVLMNCGGLIWLHTSAGQADLERLLGKTEYISTVLSPADAGHRFSL